MKGTQMGVILCQINSHPLASDFLHFATTLGAEPLNNQLIVRYCVEATGGWKLIVYISETFSPWSFEQIMILVTNKPYIPQVLQNKTIKNVQYFSPYWVLTPWIPVFPPVWRGWSSTRNCFQIVELVMSKATEVDFQQKKNIYVLAVNLNMIFGFPNTAVVKGGPKIICTLHEPWIFRISIP